MLRCYRSSCNFQHALDATLLRFVLWTPTRSRCYVATVLRGTSNMYLMLRCYCHSCNFQHALDATLHTFFMQLLTRALCFTATVLDVTSNAHLLLCCYRFTCKFKHALDSTDRHSRCYVATLLPATSNALCSSDKNTHPTVYPVTGAICCCTAKASNGGT